MLKLQNSIRIINGKNGKKAILANALRPPTVAYRGQKETADNNFGGNMFGAGNNSMVMDALPQGQILWDLMLSNIIGEQDKLNVRFYRDIFAFDAVSGSAIELMSNMPFSDFILTGCKEKERIGVYESAIAQLNMRSFLPEVSIDYLVTGAHISTLIYDRESKKFTDTISWKREDCTIDIMPLNNVDPLIMVQPTREWQAVLRGSGELYQRAEKHLKKTLQQSLNMDRAELDPLSTIFLPRKTYSTDLLGTSMYRRILPLYFLEKTLYRGTLVEFARRQRSLLHLALGDDTWEPSPDEMQAITSLFMQADLDPLGPIIATRQGISTNELRQGGDFLKYTDIIEQTGQLKLRALGISESFLSADATYSSQDVALSVFVENLRAYREMLTHKIFTTKLFPSIAAVRGFMKNKGETAAQEKIGVQHVMNDHSQYDIPSVHWRKALRPEADSQYLETLGTLKDKGVPIPLAMFAMSGGISMEALIADLEEDKKVRERIKAILGDNAPEVSGNPEMGRLAQLLAEDMGRKGPALLNREFATEYFHETPTGKRQYAPRQAEIRDKAYDRLYSTVKEMAKEGEHAVQAGLKKAQHKLGGVPNIISGGLL